MTAKPRNLHWVLCALLLITIGVIVFVLIPPPLTNAAVVNGKIAFMDGNALLTMNPDGSGQTVLISDGVNASPAWKPDGTKIAFSRNPPPGTGRAIHTMNPDGTGVQAIPNSIGDDFPSWSPDGSKIVFTHQEGVNKPEVMVMNADGTNRVPLTNDSAFTFHPVWSPDGTKIAWVSTRDFPGISGNINLGFEIYVMNADGSNKVRLTNNNFGDSNPSWSPDSNKIVFDTTRDGNFEVYVMNANGTNQVNLSNHNSSDFNPVWSPDGNRIAFLSFRDTPMGNQEVFLMNPDGSGPTRITTSSLQENQLAWQPTSGAPTPTPTPTPTPSPSPSPLVVISQVYGGGGTAGATFQASFIELFNRGLTTVDLNGWKLGITSSGGAFDSFVLPFVGSNIISLLPGQYVLIQVGSAGPNGAPVPADKQIPFVEFPTSGKLVLIKPNESIAFGSTCPLPNSGIADFVGFGNATTCFEGSGPTGNLNNTTSASRKSGGCTDNDNNVGDFFTGILGVNTTSGLPPQPTPRNSASPFNPCNLNDDVDFFVRQHYADFLNRQPDPSGLAFWKNEILQCRDDEQCVEVKRINGSAAFFLSIEFKETGYLAYRTYKAAYGLIPNTPVPLRFNEFLPDTQQLGLNVIVNTPGWEAQLESNKVAFFNDFVTRTRFTTAYATTLTPAQFVDALFANTGITPSGSARTAAIDEFGGASNTVDTAARGRALRRVAENHDFEVAELNRAFVLMQYFGYLRRNPNDAPEPNLDFAGYNFWLGKLNDFHGDFIAAEMVKAFLSSVEYRHRFGP